MGLENSVDAQVNACAVNFLLDWSGRVISPGYENVALGEMLVVRASDGRYFLGMSDGGYLRYENVSLDYLFNLGISGDYLKGMVVNKVYRAKIALELDESRGDFF